MTHPLVFLRSVGRLVAIAVYMFGLFALSLPVLVIAAACGVRGGGVRARGLQLQARGILSLMGVRVRREGGAPRHPFFLASNHLSYLDVLVLGAQTRCQFVSKAEVAHWPVLGWLVRAYGTLFVERSRKGDLARVTREVEQLLRHGHGVVFFPEATSSSGCDVLPFHSSLFESAVRAGCPVTCASLTYGTPPGSPPAEQAVCWWGRMTFFDHFFRMLGLPYVEARIAFAEQVLQADERKELAERARQTVLALFVPSADARGEAHA